jgi:hypothetical protein
LIDIGFTGIARHDPYMPMRRNEAGTVRMNGLDEAVKCNATCAYRFARALFELIDVLQGRFRVS